MSDKLRFDFDAITPRMLDDYQRETGTSLFTFLDDDGELDITQLSGSALAGVIWLALRTSGYADATMDEAFDTPISRLDMSDEAAEVDPTSASSAS